MPTRGKSTIGRVSDLPQRATAECEERLAAVFENVPMGIFILKGKDGVIVDANPKAAELVGSPREALLGKKWGAIFSAPLPAAAADFTAEFARTDGSTLPVSVNASAVSFGGRTHLLATLQDLSERKKTEESLRESEARYLDLLENANDLIQSVDPEGRFIYVNRAWKETMGYTDEEIANLRVFDIIAPVCKDHCLSVFQRVMSGERIMRVEASFTTKKGKVITLEGSVNCHFVDGKPVATRNIFRDITDRKLAEAEREEWHRTLEKKVEEKTRHLKEAQAKLVQSERMSALSEVICSAADELNNPVAGILGAVHVLRKSAQARPIEPGLMEEVDVLEDIESAATRCQRIVESLIRFSTQSRCNFAHMDLNELIGDALDLVAEQLSQAKITVRWKPDRSLPGIEGDYAKLFEVFVNILQNARTAMPEGGEIEISAHQAKGSGKPPQVQVQIRDTGCGIPAKNLGKVFEPFFTTKLGKGAGLGLTVSYGVVKKHHGDIEVKSAPGKGTKVTVTLPVSHQGA